MVLGCLHHHPQQWRSWSSVGHGNSSASCVSCRPPNSCSADWLRGATGTASECSRGKPTFRRISHSLLKKALGLYVFLVNSSPFFTFFKILSTCHVVRRYIIEFVFNTEVVARSKQKRRGGAVTVSIVSRGSYATYVINHRQSWFSCNIRYYSSCWCRAEKIQTDSAPVCCVIQCVVGNVQRPRQSAS